MDNKHRSLNLAAKICSDICPWTLSVPRSSQFSSSFTLGNCSLRGTDNVHGQISEHIFTPNEGYCLYIHCFAKGEKNGASFRESFTRRNCGHYPFPVQGVPLWRVKSSGVRQSKIYKCPERSFGS